ncbi:hypothetical protein I3842_01G029600 [Carya illinoinensis]|uniref:Uncharacterized protein n=1 Tax=Carya illinoinensis TaxID=32201 RepID=A0A922FVW9_CARIL|nr:hypothetical protein I3842_01G029600 [Carya illinoinensis]
MAFDYVWKWMPPKSLSPFFWIGVPELASSRKQEVEFETLPAFCCRCKVQRINSQTCHVGKATTGDKLRFRKRVSKSREELKDNQNQVVDVEQPVMEQKESENNADAGGSSLSNQEGKLVEDTIIGDTWGDKLGLVQQPQMANMVSNALVQDFHPLPWWLKLK